MEDLLGYKLAYACWVLKEQKTIDEIIIGIKKIYFPRVWNDKYGNSPIGCYPHSTQIGFPTFGHKKSYDIINYSQLNGFVRKDYEDTLTLDFSFWVNYILMKEMKRELKEELVHELTHELVQEVFKPEGFGQKLAELEFESLCLPSPKE